MPRHKDDRQWRKVAWTECEWTGYTHYVAAHGRHDSDVMNECSNAQQCHVFAYVATAAGSVVYNVS